MRHEIINNRKVVCEHIFAVDEIIPHQIWMPADGGKRTVEILENKKGILTYQGIEGNVLRSYTKDAKDFQSHYCLVVE